MNETKTLFSVITVVYNGQLSIGSTIQSVLLQKFENYEYIIIDGLSEDNTFNIINSYLPNSKIKLISEVDSGIYDAMNKGIKMAQGENLIFLNSGDTFFDTETLENVSKKISETEILVGSTLYKYKNAVKMVNPYDLKFIKRGMIFNHQSAFYKRTILKNYPFDLSYPISSVFDQTVKMLKDGITIKQINLPIAIYDPYGVSSNPISWSKDYLKIIYKHFKFYLPIAIARSIYRNLIHVINYYRNSNLQ